jgi:hypothetical protein
MDRVEIINALIESFLPVTHNRNHDEVVNALVHRFTPIGVRVYSSEWPIPWVRTFNIRFTLTYRSWSDRHLGVDIVRAY